MSDLPEMLPCPWCGGPAVLDNCRIWWEKRTYKGKCLRCKAYAPGDWHTDEALAIRQWNARTVLIEQTP